MTLSWVSCELATGNVIADLPTLEPDWPLRDTIGTYNTGAAKLWLDRPPANWMRATREGGAVLHCYDDELATPNGIPANPLWSGIVLEALSDTTKETIDLSLATGEAYLDRRYVGDQVFKQVGQNRIGATLAHKFAGSGGVDPGIPLMFSFGSGVNEGTLRDRSYFDVDDATVYSRLQQLSQIIGGPEWALTWRWTSDGQRILPWLTFGSRIGTPAPAGLNPAAAFELPGSVISAVFIRSYVDGKGANKVMATSSGQGDSRPQSDPQYAADMAGRPTFEKRYSPGSSIGSVTVLNDYARRARDLLAPGSNTMSLIAAIDDGPRYGLDWMVGDDVQWVIAPEDDDGNPIRQFPKGFSGVGRCIAREISERTITPILATTDLPTDDSAVDPPRTDTTNTPPAGS